MTISPAARILVAVTILWLAGFLMSRVTKVLKLPNVTGYILAGVAIGPYALDLIPADITSGMEFVTDIALAFIAFGVGRYLRLDRLKQQGTKVIVLTLMEALVTAAVITTFMLVVFHLSLPFSLLLGAIGSATAPASSLMTIRQYRAKGPFVNTLVQVVAMDDAVALLAFSVCAAIASGAETPVVDWQSVLTPLAVNAGVLLASYLLGRLLCVLLNGRSSDHRLVLTCAFVFFIAAGCAALDVSPVDIERVMRVWQAEKRARAGWMCIFPGIEKTLDGLRARGATLGIVTSKRPETYALDFSPFGLDGYFPIRITCADTALHKPHPEPLLKFLERAGAKPSEALYVGDSVYDRDCAIAAGVDFALATWGSLLPKMENVTWRLQAPEDLLEILDT